MSFDPVLFHCSFGLAAGDWRGSYLSVYGITLLVPSFMSCTATFSLDKPSEWTGVMSSWFLSPGKTNQKWCIKHRMTPTKAPLSCFPAVAIFHQRTSAAAFKYGTRCLVDHRLVWVCCAPPHQRREMLGSLGSKAWLRIHVLLVLVDHRFSCRKWTRATSSRTLPPSSPCCLSPRAQSILFSWCRSLYPAQPRYSPESFNHNLWWRVFLVQCALWYIM